METVETYPRTYKEFSVQGEDFVITDLTLDHSEDALDLLIKYVIPEENFCKALQIHKKPNAMKSMIQAYREHFQKKTSLACFRKDNKELVGLNILGVKFKDEKPSQPSDDPDLRRLRESAPFSSPFNTFEHFNVDKYLHAYGLGVKKEYRGRGIAVEILKAREPLLKALGVEVTMTIFSTISSQKAAEKAEYQEVYSVSYEEAQIHFPDYDFSKATGTHCKTFVMRV